MMNLKLISAQISRIKAEPNSALIDILRRRIHWREDHICVAQKGEG
jgi:hypothetical protein